MHGADGAVNDEDKNLFSFRPDDSYDLLIAGP
jgi:hypothetical protein